MLKNYFHITFRNITKNKGYSFIIIFGLALSLSLSLLITQMIYNFTRFDRFHENKDRIYRVVTTRTGEKWTEDFATAPFPMVSALTDDVPGIEASTVWIWGPGGNGISLGSMKILDRCFLIIDDIEDLIQPCGLEQEADSGEQIGEFEFSTNFGNGKEASD